MIMMMIIIIMIMIIMMIEIMMTIIIILIFSKYYSILEILDSSSGLFTIPAASRGSSTRGSTGGSEKQRQMDGE